MDTERLPPIHPGEILLEEFIKPYGISRRRVAKDLGVSAGQINGIVKGQRAITPNTAMRLARYFCTTERFWVNLQAHYDLEVEQRKVGAALEKEVTPLAAAVRHIIAAEKTLGDLTADEKIPTEPVDRCYYCGNTVEPGTVILEVRQMGRSRVVQSVPGDVCLHCGQGFLTPRSGRKLNELTAANS